MIRKLQVRHTNSQLFCAGTSHHRQEITPISSLQNIGLGLIDLISHRRPGGLGGPSSLWRCMIECSKKGSDEEYLTTKLYKLWLHLYTTSADPYTRVPPLFDVLSNSHLDVSGLQRVEFLPSRGTRTKITQAGLLLDVKTSNAQRSGATKIKAVNCMITNAEHHIILQYRTYLRRSQGEGTVAGGTG